MTPTTFALAVYAATVLTFGWRKPAYQPVEYSIVAAHAVVGWMLLAVVGALNAVTESFALTGAAIWPVALIAGNTVKQALTAAPQVQAPSPVAPNPTPDPVDVTHMATTTNQGLQQVAAMGRKLAAEKGLF